MPDWNTRLEVKLGDKTVTPIENFTPTFNTPHTVLHSLEADRRRLHPATANLHLHHDGSAPSAPLWRT